MRRQVRSKQIRIRSDRVCDTLKTCYEGCEVNVATLERPTGLAGFAHHLDPLSSAMSELTRKSLEVKNAVAFLRTSAGGGHSNNSRVAAAKIMEIYAAGRSTAPQGPVESCISADMKADIH